MVQRPTKLKLTPPKQYNELLGVAPNTFRPGVISLVDPTRIPKGAVAQAKNCMQTQDGVWSTRWGSMNYGQALTTPITGIIEFTITTEGVTEQWVMVMDAGKLKASKDGGAWSTLSTHTFSTANMTCFCMFENKVLIANGIDDFSYYNIATSTWVPFIALSA